MSDKKLFLIEISDFELPRKAGKFILSFSSNLPMYVVAKDYNEAFHKATFKIEELINERKQNERKVKNESIFDEDGSLRPNIYPPEAQSEPKIVNIKLIEEIVVW